MTDHCNANPPLDLKRLEAKCRELESWLMFLSNTVAQNFGQIFRALSDVREWRANSDTADFTGKHLGAKHGRVTMESTDSFVHVTLACDCGASVEITNPQRPKGATR